MWVGGIGRAPPFTLLRPSPEFSKGNSTSRGCYQRLFNNGQEKQPPNKDSGFFCKSCHFQQLWLSGWWEWEARRERMWSIDTQPLCHQCPISVTVLQCHSVTVSTVLLCGVLRSVVRYWVGYSIDSHLCQQSPPLCVAVLHSILKLRIVDWSSITVMSSITTFVPLIYRCDVLSGAKYGNHIFAKNTATQRTGSVNNLIVVWWPCGSSVSCAYVIGGCSQNVADKK